MNGSTMGDLLAVFSIVSIAALVVAALNGNAVLSVLAFASGAINIFAARLMWGDSP